METCLQSDYVQSKIGTFNDDGKRRILGCMNQYKTEANELWKKSSAAVIKDNSKYYLLISPLRSFDFPKFTYKYNSFIGQLFKISIPNLKSGQLYYKFTDKKQNSSKKRSKYAKSYTGTMLANFCPENNRYKYGNTYWCDSKDILNDKYNYTKIHKNNDSSPEGYTFSYDDTIDPTKRPNDTDFESVPDQDLIEETDLFRSWNKTGTSKGYMSTYNKGSDNGKCAFRVIRPCTSR